MQNAPRRPWRRFAMRVTFLTISALPTAATTMSARRTVADDKWRVAMTLRLDNRDNVDFEMQSIQLWWCVDNNHEEDWQVLPRGNMCHVIHNASQHWFPLEKGVITVHYHDEVHLSITYRTFDIGGAGVSDSHGGVALHEEQSDWDACVL